MTIAETSILRACALAAVFLAAGATVSDAQRPDSGAVAPPPDIATPGIASPELRPPLSPRRAFLYSLLAPGYAQSVLGRERSSALFVAFEAAAAMMIRETHANVREARRAFADSIIVSYVDDDGTVSVRRERGEFSSELLRSRREQAEDWIAVLVANHLFSAADAYVAAHLWDLPAEIAVAGDRTNRRFGLRLRW